MGAFGLARFLTLFGLGLSLAVWGPGWPGYADEEPRLDAAQSELFRSWFVRIVAEEVRRGPSPRWVHRDCASLVRFAVRETLRIHDEKWRKSSGMTQTLLPPELSLTPAQMGLGQRWKTPEGNKAAYVSALGLVQENTVFVTRDLLHARLGDLLFFDQGEDQHLMIWVGDGVTYHRGESSRQDHGLRAVALQRLLNWKDSRWQPRPENPNFLGVYSFSFLSR
ncbi:MAG: DUF1175 family protein [Magnetococcales bacterium]|nr:DUF1175 family protein [Magnetococcales bacterium]